MTSDLCIREFVPEEGLTFREEGPRLYVRGLVVPYMTPTPVIEFRDGVPVHFREQFAPGSLDRAKRAPQRLGLQYGHGTGLSERLGSGFAVLERDDGFAMEWLIDNARMDIARDVIGTSHRALSIGFKPVYPAPFTEREGELVTRRSVIPDHVAAVPVGAYPDARIEALAVRGALGDGEETDAEKAERERQERDAELLAWVDEVTEQQREMERPSV